MYLQQEINVTYKCMHIYVHIYMQTDAEYYYNTLVSILIKYHVIEWGYLLDMGQNCHQTVYYCVQRIYAKI